MNGPIDGLETFEGHEEKGDDKVPTMVPPPTDPRRVAGYVLERLFPGPHVGLGEDPGPGRDLRIPDARLDHRANVADLVDRMLSLSGRDPVTVDRKYRPAWQGRLGARIVILTNELPWVQDASGAWASRFVVLRLRESWLGKEDPQLGERLREELPRIFVWALDGYDRLRERGHFPETEASREDRELMKTMASPIAAFVADCCELDEDAETDKDALYQAYDVWAVGQGMRHRTRRRSSSATCTPSSRRSGPLDSGTATPGRTSSAGSGCARRGRPSSSRL